MNRRAVLRLLGGAVAAWPLAARAQQLSAAPVIGFLCSAASDALWTGFVAGFRQGLNETGFVEGQNVRIEFRWANGRYDQLPALAADLVGRRVAAILAAGGSDPARAAKAATTTIPIAFVSAADPVEAGLVASLNRPEGNVTGVSLIGAALEAKRLELLRSLVPGAARVAAIVNPRYPGSKSQSQELQTAAASLGVTLSMFSASTENEIDAAFTALVGQGADGILVSQDPFLDNRREQLVALSARHSLPAIYPIREAVAAGGLVSYGTHFADGFRQAGVYVGKMLKGVKPADLPVLQPTRFELVINLKTAKALGLVVPDRLLAFADEVIE